MGQDDLHTLLGRLPRATDPNLLVGAASHDDAAVYRLASGTLTVSTVDYITPVVDDPRVFGRVAAANAMSDVWAMGGRPVLALNIVVFPVAELPLELLGEILLGGAEAAAEAGVTIGGGHTIDGEIPIYGMAVMGVVDQAAMTTNAAAQPGDRLFLTKPLGSGITISALRSDTLAGAGLRRLVGRRAGVRAEELEELVRVLGTLNRAAAEAMVAAGVRAATDVTGYGLAGHLLGMLAASGVDGEVWMDALPRLAGVDRFLAQGFVPDGTRRNLAAQSPRLDAAGIAEEDMLLACDAQTSGGLLIAAGEQAAATLPQECAARGVTLSEIGRITESGKGRLALRRRAAA